jgi:uncharacterized protein YukE
MDFVSSVSKKNEDLDILSAVINLGPAFQILIPYDFMIGVTDRKKFIAYLPARNKAIKLPLTPGTPVAKEDPIYKAMETGKIQTVIMPAEVFGVPFQATGIPVKNRRGEVIGGIGVGISLNSITKLRESSHQIAATSEELSATSQELAATASQLHNEFIAVRDTGEKVLEQAQKTNDILRFINTIAANSNLLGLNAAIEAARAGKHGRGFAVVAEEIRKMAVSSGESVEEIEQIVSGIAKQTQRMLDKIEETSSLCGRQAAATEQISSSLQDLTHVAEIIEEASRNL